MLVKCSLKGPISQDRWEIPRYCSTALLFFSGPPKVSDMTLPTFVTVPIGPVSHELYVKKISKKIFIRNRFFSMMLI